MVWVGDGVVMHHSATYIVRFSGGRLNAEAVKPMTTVSLAILLARRRLEYETMENTLHPGLPY